MFLPKLKAIAALLFIVCAGTAVWPAPPPEPPAPAEKAAAARPMPAAREATAQAAGKERHRLLAHESGASCVAFAPDGKALASGGKEKSKVRIIRDLR